MGEGNYAYVKFSTGDGFVPRGVARFRGDGEVVHLWFDPTETEPQLTLYGDDAKAFMVLVEPYMLPLPRALHHALYAISEQKDAQRKTDSMYASDERYMQFGNIESGDAAFYQMQKLFGLVP